MKPKQRILALILSLAMIPATLGAIGCAKRAKVNTKPSAAVSISDFLSEAERGVIWTDNALGALEQLKATGIFSDGKLASAYEKAHRLLTQVKEAGQPAIELARSITAVDATNKQSLLDSLSEVERKLQELQKEITAIATLAIEALNKRGITSIDTATIPGKVEFAFKLLNNAFRLAKTYLK